MVFGILKYHPISDMMKIMEQTKIFLNYTVMSRCYNNFSFLLSRACFRKEKQ